MSDPPIVNLKEEDRLKARFDSFCKRVLQNALCDIMRKRKRQQGRESPLDENLIMQSGIDQYPSGDNIVRAGQFSYGIKCNSLFGALTALPESQREAVLLKYWQNWKDAQLASHFGIVTRTVRNWRNKSLQQMKIHIDGIHSVGT